VSIGVWGRSDNEELEPDAILGYADAALLEAKAAGKNRVCGHPSRSLGASDAEASQAEASRPLNED
jgi:hypothetical protein